MNEMREALEGQWLVMCGGSNHVVTFQAIVNALEPGALMDVDVRVDVGALECLHVCVCRLVSWLRVFVFCACRCEFACLRVCVCVCACLFAMLVFCVLGRLRAHVLVCWGFVFVCASECRLDVVARCVRHPLHG